MFSFSVNDKTYKVKFGYGVLTQSDILTQVSSMGSITNPKDMIKMLPELILAGLQRKHKDEFGYETEEEAREESEFAKEEYMNDWDIEGSEYDPDDFCIEIVEV